MEQEVEMMRRQQEEAERQFKMQADKLIELLKKEREEKGALFQRKPSDVRNLMWSNWIRAMCSASHG